MALSTQLGYQKPRTPATPKAPTSGVTRALAGVQPPPALPSYSDPGTIFQSPTLPSVQPVNPSAPQTYTPQAPQAPQAPQGFSFDLSTDPILQQMQASAAKQRSEADAAQLEQQKQLAIQYGDQNYGNSIDASTGQAAAQNPNSVTANLANQYQTGTHNLDESLNQHNLFYSGARINELAQALKDYQAQQATAAGAFQTALGGVNQNHVAALMGADQSVQGAYTDAYNRALQFALANQAVAPAGAAPLPKEPVGPLGIDPGFNPNNWAVTEPHAAAPAGAPSGGYAQYGAYGGGTAGGSPQAGGLTAFAAPQGQPQAPAQPQDQQQALLRYLLGTANAS